MQTLISASARIGPHLILPVHPDKDATDYFRGIVQAGEKSERVLELTENIIRQNPAHYSAWHVLLLLPKGTSNPTFPHISGSTDMRQSARSIIRLISNSI